jgi:hypothetical protein
MKYIVKNYSDRILFARLCTFNFCSSKYQKEQKSNILLSTEEI